MSDDGTEIARLKAVNDDLAIHLDKVVSLTALEVMRADNAEAALAEALRLMEPFAEFHEIIDGQGPRGTWMGTRINDPNGGKTQIDVQDWRGRGERKVYEDDVTVVVAVEEMAGGNCPASIDFGHLRALAAFVAKHKPAQ